jgi:mannose-6-phosphate isomerase-like protein (cupin superfamily)
MKRAIFGVKDGLGTVLIDGPPATVHDRGPGASMYDIWAARGPQPTFAVDDITATIGPGLDVGPGGVIFRIAEMPPRSPDAPPGSGMHRTWTVDYGVVLSGRITVVMEDGTSASLDPGDCLVQIGGKHEWYNEGPESCVIAFWCAGVDRDSVRAQG